MGRVVRVPDPVYGSIERIAEREDMSYGEVIRRWKEKADKFDKVNERY